MDTFIDKIAQKFTAQEMIRANAEAEAAQLQRARSLNAQYEQLLLEIKAASRTNAENAKQVQVAAAQAIAKLEDTDKVSALVDASLAKIEEIKKEENDPAPLFEELTEHVHKENVKVYRNVQAALVEETAKLGEQMAAARKSLSAKLSAVLAISIVALLAAAASLTFQILTWLNII